MTMLTLIPGAVSLADGSLDPYAPTTDGTVNALAVNADASRVYLGGQFSNVNGTARPYIAITDGAGALTGPTITAYNSPPVDLDLSDDGTRLATGNLEDNRGSIYNTATGARIWRQACEGNVQAVRIVDGSMFSGFHDACDGVPTRRVAGNRLSDGARDRHCNRLSREAHGPAVLRVS